MLQPVRFKELNSRCTVQLKAKSARDRPLSIKLYWLYRRHVAFAIGTTSNRSPSSRVWSAAAGLPMPTISDLRNHQHSAARLATSSLYRFAEVTIAKSIAAETKRPGGRGPVSMRARRLASFGLKRIPCQVQLVKPGQNCETKPIWKLAHYDLIPANRG